MAAAIGTMVVICHCCLLLLSYSVMKLMPFFFPPSIPRKNLECMIAKPDLVLTAIKVRKDLVTVMSVRSFTVSTQCRQIC